MFHALIFFGVVSGSPAFAKAHRHHAPMSHAKVSPLAAVERVLEHYRKLPAFKAALKKTVTQEIMGTKIASTGQFYFSRGKLRLEINKPERSLLVYDGHEIWSESNLDESTVQVSFVRAGTFKRGDSLLASLFERKNALKLFHLVHHSEVNGQSIFDLAPKDPKSAGLVSLELTTRGEELERLKYKDQMDNTVDFELSEPKHGALPAKLFSYHPPKGAIVTELK